MNAADAVAVNAVDAVALCRHVSGLRHRVAGQIRGDLRAFEQAVRRVWHDPMLDQASEDEAVRNRGLGCPTPDSVRRVSLYRPLSFHQCLQHVLASRYVLTLRDTLERMKRSAFHTLERMSQPKLHVL